MRRWTVVSVIAFGALAGWLFAFQPEQVQLRFQFQPKQVLTYEATDQGEGTMTFNFGGQDVASQMQMEMKTTDTYQVERVSDYGDAILVRTTRGKMTFKVTTPTGEEKRETRDLPTTRVRMQVDPDGASAPNAMAGASRTRKGERSLALRQVGHPLL